MTANKEAVVVGVGVIGLTTAVGLAEAGVRTRVVAEEVPGTTSLAAGALWGPYLVEPKDKVHRWSHRSLDVFTELAADPATGVRLATGVEASRATARPPAWDTSLPGFTPASPADLPAGFTSGFRFRAPLIDMPRYLDYLRRRLLAAGGSVEQRSVATLDDSEWPPLVVNCAGIGADKLAPDPGLRPIRGQHVVVTNPGLTEFFSEDTGQSPELLCIYPHSDTVVLGGTARDGDGSLDEDKEAAAGILARCREVEPRLADARILEHRIGLRPTRSAVRVEALPRRGGLLIHNYGHGGAGVTLSWGCAEEVRRYSEQAP